jgi:hypothetical protein
MPAICGWFERLNLGFVRSERILAGPDALPQLLPMADMLTPDQALTRILRLSRLNGWSVAVVAGLGTLVALLLGDPPGAFVGLAAVLSGAMEIRGNRRLQAGRAEGMRWLVRAQLLLLAVILVYSTSRIASYDDELALENVTPAMREALGQLELRPEDLLPFVRTALWLGYGTVMLVTCVYQGGLALYYRRRTPLVEQALAGPPLIGSAGAAGIEPHCYEAAMDEVARQAMQPDLWARALKDSDGDAVRAAACYIRLRAADLQRGAGNVTPKLR